MKNRRGGTRPFTDLFSSARSRQQGRWFMDYGFDTWQPSLPSSKEQTNGYFDQVEKDTNIFGVYTNNQLQMQIRIFTAIPHLSRVQNVGCRDCTLWILSVYIHQSDVGACLQKCVRLLFQFSGRPVTPNHLSIIHIFIHKDKLFKNPRPFYLKIKFVLWGFLSGSLKYINSYLSKYIQESKILIVLWELQILQLLQMFQIFIFETTKVVKFSTKRM